jgi:glycosyltransferase involved in cell wall biosynthesis
MRDGRRHAIVVGFDYYGRFLAGLINEQSDTWRLTYYPSTRLGMIRAFWDARGADAVVCFGGPAPNSGLVEIARKRDIPVIVIWAGTDVLTARRDPHLFEVIKRDGMINVSDGPWLVDELRDLGVNAKYVPVTAIDPAPEPAPFPSDFSVLTYLPEPRRAFYGERSIYAIARELPEVRFRVVGRGGRNPVAPPNVEFLGYVNDMAQRIDDSCVILRLPEHDGKSMLVLEALSRGRHVIWNYDFPCVHYVERTVDATEALRELYRLHSDGKLEINHAGRSFTADNFNRGHLAEGFEAVLDGAASTGTEAVREPRKSVVISGLHLFTAQIAEQIDNHAPAWAPQILRMRARVELFASMLHLLNADVWYSIGAPIGDRRLHILGRILRKPRVIHWVGSDIDKLHTDMHLRTLCRLPHVRNLAEVEWTLTELRSLGIEASLAPLPPRLRARDVPPMPKQFTVLLYLPKTRGEFYGRREYERLIRAFGKRNVRFVVVGGGELYSPPDVDVTRLGWCTSLDSVYEESSVLIRFTKHDGLSLMALEALTFGRYVLWSQDFPFATQVKSYDDIERNIANLLERHERGELQPQYDGARYVTETYDAGRCIKNIVNSWEALCEPATDERFVAMEKTS